MPPETRYAKNGELSIAYQVVGDGPFDLVMVPGFVSHVDLWWSDPASASFLRRLSSFARLIIFDKPGTGLSDPVTRVRTIEERMEDMRAVLDAAGSERAALLGLSEGGPMSMVFAATYPERTRALVVYGSFSRATVAHDYFPEDIDGFRARMERIYDLERRWGEGGVVELFAPSAAGNPALHRFWALFERAAASPSMVRALNRANGQVDVRAVLPTISVPTLVLHRDREFIPAEHGRYIADRIPGARFVELSGIDHAPFFGDSAAVCDEIEEFLTGARGSQEPERALLSVLFTDIVDSTRRAAELGDARWRDLLERHDAMVAQQAERFRGRVVKSTGDGALATFDGPARAIHCAQAITDEARELGIELRAGVHTGECELLGADVGGIAVHIGARVAALADPGEVVVSSTVKDLVVGSGLEFRDRGEAELKGVPGVWRTFTVGSGESKNAMPRVEVPEPERELRRGDRTALRIARRTPGAARAAVRLVRGRDRAAG